MTARTPETNRIAIPCFGEEVAPLFGAARRFRVWDILRGKVVQYEEIACEEGEGISRTRLMRELNVTLVIANGIEHRQRQLLETEERRVIDGVIGTATDALFGYLAGRIQPAPPAGASSPGPQTADVVEWTRDLFLQKGWEVTTVHESELFPVDLICEQSCPHCGKPVRIAVCCGAHAYRVDEEIREFQRVTSANYHARVFVHQAIETVAATCHSYGIELLDPAGFARMVQRSPRRSDLPPLKGTIETHTALNAPSVA